MQITVYTKKDCGLCADFKDKLVNHLKVPFAERDLADAKLQCETWRTDGTVDVIAAHAMIDEKMPLVLIDGRPFRYAQATAHIKKHLDAGGMVEKPEKVPGDGKDVATAMSPLNEEDFVERLFEVARGSLDIITVHSDAKRTYAGRSTKRWQFEALGTIKMHVKLRDPRQKPMKLFEFDLKGEDFRELLVEAEIKIRAGKEQGRM